MAINKSTPSNIAHTERPIEYFQLKTPSWTVHTEKSPIHISHLMEYVSAYVPSSALQEQLVDDLRDAILRAKKTRESVRVDQDGEMFFLVSPAGEFDLCLRWQRFKFVDGKE